MPKCANKQCGFTSTKPLKACPRCDQPLSASSKADRAAEKKAKLAVVKAEKAAKKATVKAVKDAKRANRATVKKAGRVAKVRPARGRVAKVPGKAPGNRPVLERPDMPADMEAFDAAAREAAQHPDGPAETVSTSPSPLTPPPTEADLAKERNRR